MDQPAASLATGLAHHRNGAFAAAAACYRAVLAGAPAHADARHLLGLALHQDGASAAALPHLEAACTLRPEVAHFLANTGIACLAAGMPARAEAWLHKAIAAAPQDAGARHDLGLALLRQDRPAEAEIAFRQCLSRQPDAIDAQINLGAALVQQGRSAMAEEGLRTTVQRAPQNSAALCGLAAALTARGPSAEAEALLRKALALKPDDADIMTRLGMVLRDAGKFDAAEHLLREAARRQPGTPDPLSNLGNALAAAGQLVAAEASLRTALNIAPGHADAAYTLGTTLLLGGRWVEGWAGFERRWQRRGFSDPAPTNRPRWTGGATGDHLLLLYGEQGLGDSIQMARFVPLIAARHRVALAVPAALMRLFSTLPGIERIATEPGEHDLACPLMSLPHVLGIATEAQLATPPYLHANPQAVAAWQTRLATRPGLKAGIAWAGNPDYAADFRRSIPPDDLAALAGVAGVTFVSLQKSARPPATLEAHDWTADLTDLADTAALIAALDLVITVDTAVTHLAGALGKPVWLLNRFDPCWRWMLGRDDSPWYPSLRQFRQPSPGDWHSVLAAVRRALAQRVTVWASSSARSTATPSPGPSGTWIIPPPARSTSGQMSSTSA